MSTATATRRHAQAGPDNGGVPARRAVMRWAWRLFRREWRQQMLVLALITVAVGATVIGAAVATTTPPAANSGFGTAQDLAILASPHLATQIASLEHRFGRVDVIENEAMAIPGSVNSFDLRAQNPDGPFGPPMLSLVSGHYPTAANQVALTQAVASAFGVTVGDTWPQPGGPARQVTGIVQNPQSLLDEFALVIPGQVTAPTQVTVLFDAPGIRPSTIGPNVETPQSVASSNPLNPVTIVLALAMIGMLLIALVAVGGFTVLAQRRVRSLGMLGALGATDQRVRLVVRTNGVVVGVVGAVLGLVVGVAGWLAYRPSVESSAHHLIGAFQLPWIVIGPAMALAVVATYFASARPARAISRLSVVAALSGRPAPPKQVHRSAIPGIILLVIAGFALSYAGSSNGGGGAPELLGGLIALVIGVILLAPTFLSVLAKLAAHTPIAARLALRDLGRYRARSGSALAASSLGVLIAVMVCVLTAGRYGNVLDYAGPNLSGDQLIVYAPGNGPGNGPGSQPGPGAGSPRTWSATAHGIASGLGSSDVVELESTSGSLQHAAPGRSWSGPIYLATPQLLAAFGIKASQVDPNADILTMRSGLSGLSKMQLVYGNYFGPNGGQGGGPQQNSFPCPKGECLAGPVIQEAGALPSGTSAPNTVITEHAIQQLGLGRSVSVTGWLIQAPHGLTAAQISSARLTAAAKGMSIETRSSAPSSAEILNWATVFGTVLALGILAMTIGLIRSETASDLRTLTATGAGSATRRTITAVTAGALALAGAVLGTAGAYIAAIAYSWDNKLDGLGSLRNIPVSNLLTIRCRHAARRDGRRLAAGRARADHDREAAHRLGKPRETTGAGQARRTCPGPFPCAPGSRRRRGPRTAAGPRRRPRRYRRRSRSGWPAPAATRRRRPTGSCRVRRPRPGRPGCRRASRGPTWRSWPRSARAPPPPGCPGCTRSAATGARRPAPRLPPSSPPAADPERGLELPGGALADDQAQLVPDRLRDRLVHGVARLAQRLRPDHPPAGHRRDLGGPAADVDHETADPAGQVEPGAGRRGDRLVDEPHVVPGAPDGQRRDDRAPLHRRGAAGHADQCVAPQRAGRAAGLAQEPVQHLRGGVQVGDDPVAQRVDDLDVLRFLVRERVGGLPYRGHLADGRIDRDGGRLLKHNAAPCHPDERVDRPEVDGHATAEAHVAPLCPT